MYNEADEEIRRKGEWFKPKARNPQSYLKYKGTIFIPEYMSPEDYDTLKRQHNVSTAARRLLKRRKSGMKPRRNHIKTWVLKIVAATARNDSDEVANLLANFRLTVARKSFLMRALVDAGILVRFEQWFPYLKTVKQERINGQENKESSRTISDQI